MPSNKQINLDRTGLNKLTGKKKCIYETNGVKICGLAVASNDSSHVNKDDLCMQKCNVQINQHSPFKSTVNKNCN